jgi:hypothetical protein
MALIKCGECKKEISDKAEVCPNCGCPVDQADAGSKKAKEQYVKKEMIAETDKQDKHEMPVGRNNEEKNKEEPIVWEAIADSVDKLLCRNKNENENNVANRLNQIGDTLFGINAIIGGVIILGLLVAMDKLNLGGWVVPIFIIIGLHILIIYIIKTLFNGLAENIQILHDIRSDMRDKKINKE